MIRKQTEILKHNITTHEPEVKTYRSDGQLMLETTQLLLNPDMVNGSVLEVLVGIIPAVIVFVTGCVTSSSNENNCM